MDDEVKLKPPYDSLEPPLWLKLVVVAMMAWPFLAAALGVYFAR